MCLTLVQTDLCTALHVRIKQPFDDEERPFHPFDFAQGHRQFLLSGVGANFRSSWLGGMTPIAIVAALRKMSASSP